MSILPKAAMGCVIIIKFLRIARKYLTNQFWYGNAPDERSKESSKMELNLNNKNDNENKSQNTTGY